MISAARSRIRWKHFLPWIFLSVMGISWGLSFSLGKIAVESGGAPLGIALFQAMFSAIILLVITLVRRKPILELREHLGLITIIGVLGSVLPGSLFYYSASHVQAGVLSITIALIPLMTYGASVPLGMEKFSVKRFAGLLCGIVAIALIALPQNSLPDRAAIPWILLACVSSLSYSGENLVLAARSVTRIGPIRMSMGMNVMASLMLFPIASWNDSLLVFSYPFGSLEYSVIGLSLISVVAYTMFVMSVGMFGPVFASQTGYIVTLSGVFWGMYIFDETHSYWVWMALGLMMIGLTLVTPRNSEETDTA